MDTSESKIENILFAILLPIISVGISFAISIIKNAFGIMPVLVTLSIILAIVPISCYLAFIIFSSLWQEDIQRRTDEIIVAKKGNSGLREELFSNGIYRQEKLVLIETSGHFDEIWIVSPDLHNEDLHNSSNSGVWAGVVQQNLKNGTKYRYFVPRTTMNEHRVEMLRNSCGHSSNLEVYYLSDNFFFLVQRMDIIIYEPMKSATDGRKGFIGLPLDGITDTYAVIMNSDFVDSVSTKLMEVIKEAEK